MDIASQELTRLTNNASIDTEARWTPDGQSLIFTSDRSGKLQIWVMDVEGKKLSIKHVPGPLGVRGRNSDNRLISEKLGWAPGMPLKKGLEVTYTWIKGQVERFRK